MLQGRCLPSTLTVTATADRGTGSLRTEISAAQSGDTFGFASNLDGHTISLTADKLAIE
jgi:hypothetical protein